MNKIIAMYLRYSKDDDREENSESIINQRKLVKSYINSKEELLKYKIEEFCDDGFTGTNMNRPALQKLRKLVIEKKIYCVIVKDFSRLGRNTVDVTELLYTTFPKYDVKVVSLDNDFNNNEIDFGVITTNILNELYSRNLSNNLKAVIKDKMIHGKYKYKFGFFGYRKDNNGQLVIDKNATEIVRNIYNMFVSGKGLTEIARKLNDENIPTPYKYRKMYSNEVNRGKMINGIWTKDTVKLILSDERYTGKFVGGKTSNNLGARLSRIPESDWIKIENHHEAIISDELFQTVKSKFKKRKYTRTNNKSLFAGKLICKCGCNLLKYYKDIYVCNNSFYINECRDKIKENELIKMLLPLINSKIDIINKNEEHFKNELLETKKRLASLKKQKEIEINKLFSIFEDYNDQNISIEVYKKKKVEITEKIKNIDKEIDFIELNFTQKSNNIYYSTITDVSREVVDWTIVNKVDTKK